MSKVERSKKSTKKPRTQQQVMTTCLEEIDQACASAAKDLLSVRNRLDDWHFQLHDVRNSVPSPGAVDLQFATVCRELWLAMQSLQRIGV